MLLPLLIAAIVNQFPYDDFLSREPEGYKRLSRSIMSSCGLITSQGHLCALELEEGMGILAEAKNE